MTLDADPETGQPAVCFCLRLCDLESTVACVSYGLGAMRAVAAQVTQALVQLEAMTVGDHGDAS